MNVGGVYRALASRRRVDIRPANAVPVKKAIEKVSQFGPLVVALRGYDQAFPGGCYEVRINQGETRFFELNVDARMAKHSPLIFNAVPLATAPHEQVLSLPPPFCLPCTKHEDFLGERGLPAHCADSGRPGDGRVRAQRGGAGRVDVHLPQVREPGARALRMVCGASKGRREYAPLRHHLHRYVTVFCPELLFARPRELN